jgi:hypothetical protein
MVKITKIILFEPEQLEYLESKGNICEYVRELVIRDMKSSSITSNQYNVILNEQDEKQEALLLWKEKVKCFGGCINNEIVQAVIEEMAFDYKCRKSWWLIPTLDQKIEFMRRMKKLEMEMKQ